MDDNLLAFLSPADRAHIERQLAELQGVAPRRAPMQMSQGEMAHINGRLQALGADPFEGTAYGAPKQMSPAEQAHIARQLQALQQPAMQFMVAPPPKF